MKIDIWLDSFDWFRPTGIEEFEKGKWRLVDNGEWPPRPIKRAVLQSFKYTNSNDAGAVEEFYTNYGPLTREQRAANVFTRSEFFNFHTLLLTDHHEDLSDVIKRPVVLIGHADTWMRFKPYNLADYIRCIYQEEIELERLKESAKEDLERQPYKMCLAPQCTNIITKSGKKYCSDRCRTAAKNHRNRYAKEHYGVDTWAEAKDLITEGDINAVEKKVMFSNFDVLETKDS